MLRLAVPLILAAGVASAQASTSPRCAPKDYVLGLLSQTGKVLAAEGLTGTQVFQLYKGPDDMWMTIVLTTDGFACVNAGGAAWTEIDVQVEDDPS